MRFSIRDLLWLTAVVALTVGWSVNRSKLLQKVDAVVIEANGCERRTMRVLARRDALIKMIEAQGWQVVIGDLDTDGGQVQFVVSPNGKPKSQAPATKPPDP